MTDLDTADATAEPGRRERKKRQTREELMHQAALLFSARGFDAVTTEDIAEAADVSQRTFFRHFPSKEAVLYGHTDDLKAAIRASFEARPAEESTVEAIRAAMGTIADHYEVNRDEAYLQAQLATDFASVAAHARAVVQAEWEHELTAAIAARAGVDPLADPFPEILAGAAFAAFRAAIRRWSAAAGRADFRDLLDESLAVLVTLTD